MTSTPYKVINWNDADLIGEDKMDALVNNTQWLYDNSLRAVYTLSDTVARAEGVRLVGGRVTFPASASDEGVATVTFPNFFSVGCYPIVTTGIINNFAKKCFCTINGLGTMIPVDYRGFQCAINIANTTVKTDRIIRTMYVNWMALGY